VLEGFLIVSHIILLCAVLYFIWETKKKDRVQETEIISIFKQTINDVLGFIVDGNKKLYETIEKTQIKYFDSFEKGIQKQNALLEKNDREFLKVFAEVFKKSEVKSKVEEISKPFEADKVENSIENASQPEDVLLSDMPRVPIVDGVKIKFEDEEEVYPMNISPVDQGEPANPIEKS
jgi:hypothetical protein